MFKKFLFYLIFLVPIFCFAAGGDHSGDVHLDGSIENMGIVWVIPFAGILLSIAIFPLVLPDFWHHNFGKVSLFWATILIVPFLIKEGISVTLYELLHVGLLEYVPFIILLLALFTISGGVRLTGTLVGTPIVNLTIIAIGTLLASWMGTTGAAMLLVRPLINANKHRKNKVHIIVFFIFLVANIGGSLTPLGDPPLFLGFLKGVSFFWYHGPFSNRKIFVIKSLFLIFGLVPFFHWLSIAPADLLAALAPGVWRTFLLYGAGYAYFSSLTPAPITPARALGGSHVAWHVLVVAGLREWAEVCRQMLAQEAVGCDAWR